MKLKKLLALTLSMAMVFSSFTVPALADEIVESVNTAEEIAAKDVAVEEVSEALATQEINESAEEITEEEIEVVKAEDTEGNTYTVATGDDLIAFLTTKDNYALAKKNANKMITFVLSNDIEVSANKISIPADRYITIDLNGNRLTKSATGSDKPIVLGNAGDKYAMLIVENGIVENGGYIDLDFEVNGGEKGKALLEIGEYVSFDGKATVKGGIVKADANSEIFGEIESTSDKDDVNIQGSIEAGATVKGVNITLANATVTGDVKSAGNLTVTGKTTGDIEVTSGKAIIACDNGATPDEWLGNITIGKDASVIMESGCAEQIILDDETASFTMKGGRVENASGDAIVRTNSNKGKLNLINGTVCGTPEAINADEKWNNEAGEVTGTGKAYIINGIEADEEAAVTNGEIYNVYDLEKAAKNGGTYVLAANINVGTSVNVEKDLTITNKAAYTISRKLVVATGKTLTINANISGGVDVSAANAKLVMLGGFIYGSPAVKVEGYNADGSLKDVEIIGGTIVGDDVDDAKCAITDGVTGYKDCANYLIAGEPRVEASIRIDNDKDYVLMLADGKNHEIELNEIFDDVYVSYIDPASVSINCIFGNGTNKSAGMEISGKGEWGTDKITYDGKSTGSDRLICKVTYAGKEIASEYITIESTNAKTLAELAAKYNATLVKTNDTMNAYEKAHKIYFDFHLASSEAGLLGSDYKSFKPKYASIDVPRGSRFAEYFRQNGNGLYDVKYDAEKGQYYVELQTKTVYTDPAFETTKLAQNSISSFSGLNIRLQFFAESYPTKPVFTVPMTKYAYDKAVPSGKDNTEQALTLNVDTKSPALTMKEGAKLNINAAFDPTKDGYRISYPELEDANDNDPYITPGFVRAQDIYDITEKDIALEHNNAHADIYLNQKTGNFKYDNGKFFYSGSVDTTAVEDVLKVRVRYAEYYGEHNLTIPVSIVKTYPAPTLKKSSFSVVKGSAVTNIPLTFTSSTPDAVGGITRVEVISGRKTFTVVDNKKNIESVDYKTYTNDSYSLNIAGISDKAAKGKIKVYFDNCKPLNGVAYSMTYELNVKTVEPAKMKAKAKSKDVLNLKASGTASAVYTITTNPEYYASADVNVAVNAYAKGSKTPIADASKWLSVSKLEDGKVTITAENPAANAASVKDIKLEIKVGESKPVYAKVKVNNKDAAVKKSSVTVKMTLGAESFKEYNNGKVKVDQTATKMGKSVKYNANNLTFASVSGNDANLFRVKDVTPGKVVKVMPRLDALKAGKLEAGKDYEIKLNLKELGTDKLTDKQVTVKISIAPVKENKVTANIATEDITLSTTTPHAGALFEINTVKPYYGMKIADVTIDSKGKNSGYFVVEKVSAGNSFTALGNDEGKNDSLFLVGFKDGKAPVVKSKLMKGAQKLTLIVKYENGLSAKISMVVNVDVDPKAVEEEDAKTKKK